MRFFVDTANSGETKKAYEMRVMDGFTTKRVFGGLEEGSQDRVGGGLTAPASHTTVRAVRHTAVREIILRR
jgi:hypothetical protein